MGDTDDVGTRPVHLILIQDVVHFEGEVILPYVEELVFPWDSKLLDSGVCSVVSGRVPWSARAGNQARRRR